MSLLLIKIIGINNFSFTIPLKRGEYIAVEKPMIIKNDIPKYVSHVNLLTLVYFLLDGKVHAYMPGRCRSKKYLFLMKSSSCLPDQIKLSKVIAVINNFTIM